MAAASPVLEHREHDHRRCAADAIRHAEISRAARGCASPPSAARCWRRCSTSHVPASAYDVIDRLAEGGKRLAPVSVYRALEFLVENGFAHRIESKSAYVACDRGAECTPEATLFLICDNCGAAGEASSEELGRLVSDETKSRAFMPRLRVLEIRGLCARCRTA